MSGFQTLHKSVWNPNKKIWILDIQISDIYCKINLWQSSYVFYNDSINTGLWIFLYCRTTSTFFRIRQVLQIWRIKCSSKEDPSSSTTGIRLNFEMICGKSNCLWSAKCYAIKAMIRDHDSGVRYSDPVAAFHKRYSISTEICCEHCYSII